MSLRKAGVGIGVLLALILVSSWLLYWNSLEDAHANLPALTDIRAENITTLQMTRRDGRRVALARTGDAWRITQPFVARANRYAVAPLLDLASRQPLTRIERRPAGGYIPPRLGKRGLAPARVTVRFNDAEIAIGDDHPLRSETFVEARGAVWLVASQAIAPTLRAATDFIETRLIEEGCIVEAIRLPGFTASLHQGTWHGRPAEVAADSDALHAFAMIWEQARALWVRPERPGVHATGIRLDLRCAPEQKTRHLALTVISTEPEFILHRSDEGLSYVFPRDMGRQMMGAAGGFIPPK